MSRARIIALVVALIAIGIALGQLQWERRGLVVRHATIETARAPGGIPVTVFRPRRVDHAPVIVIAHGFAGSQQLMQPFAITLARNGFVAVTFDLPGHGRNPAPLIGGIANDARRNADLLGAVDRVVAWARSLPWSDGHIGLLGHSMASDIVIRYADDHPIDGTVAVSVFSPSVTREHPRDLLLIVGALEPQVLRDEALRIVGLTSGGTPETRITYGSIADGTARRVSFSGGVEHIGVLYSKQSMEEALAWFDAVFAHNGSGYLDEPGPWFALLFAGLVLLAWPLAALLPRAATLARCGFGLGWLRLLPAAIAPAVLTPLITYALPTDFLPILLGDYLAVHFAVYGLLTALCILILRRRLDGPSDAGGVHWLALAAAAALVALYSIGAVGVSIDTYLTSFMPIASRIPLIAAVLAGTIPYFVADEYLTRGPGAAPGGYAFTKICFLASLMLATALNLQRLFFLIIIVPVILIFFVIFGLFSTWAYRRTWHPLVGALANALAFAWAIAVTFPVVQ